MNKLPKLYGRSNTGKVLEWTVEFDEKSFWVISGQKDGAKVKSEPNFCQGKNSGKSNQTTDSEQSFLEAKAKWDKKKKEGYFEDINDIDKELFIQPQLAKVYSDYEDKIDFAKEKWIYQNKYNGIACIASKRGVYSRKGEEFLSFPHIPNALKSFFETYPDSFLHGEIFNDNYRQKLNEIVKLCRKTVNISQQDLRNSEELIRFYIYDGSIPEVGLGEDKPYHERKRWIDKNVINIFGYCCEVPSFEIKSKEQLTQAFQKAIERGDEGLMLRKLNMPYCRKRTRDLLKFKPTDTDEFVITDIKEGSGNWAGKAKIIGLRAKDGKEFNCSFKGSMLDAEKCLREKKNWINKSVSIEFMGYGGLGTPNFAQFNYNNCLRID